MLLTCTPDDGSPITVRLKELPRSPVVTIGRGKEATLCIEDSKASRIHAAILYWDDAFIVRDMKSSNGTYVNGEQVEVAMLHPGDSLKIGDTEFHAGSEGKASEVTMAG